MPNIRDIIGAATPGPWKWEFSEGSTGVRGAGNKHVLSSWAWEEGPADVDCDYPDAEFIVTFDPEHVALMEAVIEPTLLMDERHPGHLHELIERRNTAVDALIAYRKERDLL